RPGAGPRRTAWRASGSRGATRARAGSPPRARPPSSGRPPSSRRRSWASSSLALRRSGAREHEDEGEEARAGRGDAVGEARGEVVAEHDDEALLARPPGRGERGPAVLDAQHVEPGVRERVL